MAKFEITEELLSQIENLQMLLKNNVAGMFGGNHKSRTYGSSCEFADYRDYVDGDDTTKLKTGTIPPSWTGMHTLASISCI